MQVNFAENHVLLNFLILHWWNFSAAYLGAYAYSFGKHFQGLCLFGGLRLLGSLEQIALGQIWVDEQTFCSDRHTDQFIIIQISLPNEQQQRILSSYNGWRKLQSFSFRRPIKKLKIHLSECKNIERVTFTIAIFNFESLRMFFSKNESNF